MTRFKFFSTPVHGVFNILPAVAYQKSGYANTIEHRIWINVFKWGWCFKITRR